MFDGFLGWLIKTQKWKPFTEDALRERPGATFEIELVVARQGFGVTVRLAW